MLTRSAAGRRPAEEVLRVFAVLSVLIIVTLSLVVTRIATVALTLTGLSREVARFQARSALTGTGYATSESERIVRHPVRRRIVMLLMLIGSAGVVTVIASLVLSFASSGGARDVTARLALLLAGLVLLYLAASSRWLDRALEPVMTRALRRFTDIDVRDYAKLLHIHGDFAVSELAVEDHDWLANRRLEELRLADEGLLVLGVERDATTYLGAPTGKTRIHAGDVLIVYGSTKRLAELDRRPEGDAGEQAHDAATEAAQEERRHSADPLGVGDDRSVDAVGTEADPGGNKRGTEGEGRAAPAVDGHRREGTPAPPSPPPPTATLPEDDVLTRPLPEDPGRPR